MEIQKIIVQAVIFPLIDKIKYLSQKVVRAKMDIMMLIIVFAINAIILGILL